MLNAINVAAMSNFYLKKETRGKWVKHFTIYIKRFAKRSRVLGEEHNIFIKLDFFFWFLVLKVFVFLLIVKAVEAYVIG